MTIAIIDSGGANIASLQFALQRLEAESELTRDPRVLQTASHVLLPGVGAAADAMTRLRQAGLHTVIPRLTQPVLGICLGMQLLFTDSAEGDVDCLGIIDGRVEPLAGGPDLTIPHMGWNQISRSGDCKLMDGLDDGEYFYFVHSYAAGEGPATRAVSEHGERFSAIVGRDNFHGTQFHPERSGTAGARVLRNFLESG
ncbi:MAG: imidazole glycerol phosphate synthase subunit HisH [Gammaproteobacteria bacterium]|jgi:glutamine amidotransferase